MDSGSSQVDLPKKNWITATRNMDQTMYLDESYEMVAKRPPFFKVDLYPHQRTVVKAMLELEQKRKMNIRPGPVFDTRYIDRDIVCETNAGMLTEKFGSGKSYEVLATICFSKAAEPRKGVAEISYIPFTGESKNYHHRKRVRRDKREELIRHQKFKGFDMEVRRAYRKNINTTLIFVGVAAMNQWKQYITEQTTLRMLAVENLRDLKAFYKSVFQQKNGYKSLERFDVVVVKNGKITGTFNPPELFGTYMEGKPNKFILSIFSEWFKSCCFRRVVLDDFDTLDMSWLSTVIPTQFTWFVSRTSCKKEPNDCEPNTYYTLADHLWGQRSIYLNMWGNRHLLTTFNIQNESRFIDQCMHVGLISHFTYQFINPNENYVRMLGAMQLDDANEIMEMLNGDAIATAADRVGIKTDSVGDIFEKILGRSANEYKKCVSIEAYIPKAETAISGLPQPENAMLSMPDAKRTMLRKNILRPGPLSKIADDIKYRYTGIQTVIDEAKAENAEKKEEVGKAIDRVKSCLKDEDCPLCAEEFSDEDVDVIILKCCGIVVCGFCVGSRINLKSRDQSITTNCPRCSAIIGLNAFIMLSKDVKIEDILNDKIESLEDDADADADASASTAPSELIPESPKKPETPKTKFDMLIDIIQNPSRVGEPRNITIPGVASSSRPLGAPQPDERKVLIFASFRETLNNVQARLEAASIRYARVSGSSSQITNAQNMYNLPNSEPSSINVLLVNAAKHCASLNLQATTDVIFMHEVMDSGVRAQLVGRAVRIGRHHDLRVHWLLYENETHAH